MEKINNVTVFEFQLQPNVFWPTRHGYLSIVSLGWRCEWFGEMPQLKNVALYFNMDLFFSVALFVFVSERWALWKISCIPFLLSVSSIRQSMGIYKWLRPSHTNSWMCHFRLSPIFEKSGKGVKIGPKNQTYRYFSMGGPMFQNCGAPHFSEKTPTKHNTKRTPRFENRHMQNDMKHNSKH